MVNQNDCNEVENKMENTRNVEKQQIRKLDYIYDNRDNSAIQSAIEGKGFQEQVRDYFGTYDSDFNVPSPRGIGGGGLGLHIHTEKINKNNKEPFEADLENIVGILSKVSKEKINGINLPYEETRMAINKKAKLKRWTLGPTLIGTYSVAAGLILGAITENPVVENIAKVITWIAGIPTVAMMVYAPFHGVLNRKTLEHPLVQDYEFLISSAGEADKLIENHYLTFAKCKDHFGKIESKVVKGDSE